MGLIVFNEKLAPPMPLNERQVDSTKPKEKPYKLADGGGLNLLVNTNGSRYWRMKYRFAGKEKKRSFGTFLDVSLADARAKRDEARKNLAKGSDPGYVKKAEQLAKKQAVDNTFESIATEWLKAEASGWSEEYADYVCSSTLNLAT